MKRLLIVPTMAEAELLFDALRKRPEASAPFPLLKEGNTFIAVSGAGKVNAACCTCYLLSRLEVKEVWVAGIGGAYPGSGLHIGDVLVAEKEVYGDESFEPREFPMHVPRWGTESGVFVTLSVLPRSQEEAGLLEKRFRAKVENMEGAAVAHAASLFGVKVTEIRAISNTAGVRDKKLWNIPLALERLWSFLLEKLA